MERREVAALSSLWLAFASGLRVSANGHWAGTPEPLGKSQFLRAGRVGVDRSRTHARMTHPARHQIERDVRLQRGDAERVAQSAGRGRRADDPGTVHHILDAAPCGLAAPRPQAPVGREGIALFVSDLKVRIERRHQARRQRHFAHRVAAALQRADGDDPAIELERGRREFEQFARTRARIGQRKRIERVIAR